MTVSETETNKPKQNQWVKLLIELGPLIVFFASFKFADGDLFIATGVFMVSMIAAMAVSWVTTRHIAPMLWVTFVIVMVMGSLTIYLQDETFVKMKPTLVNAIFAVVLAFGLLTGKSLLKTVLEASFPPMEERGWLVLTRNWTLFFAFMAILNEIIWRTQTTDFWVNFKTFGFLPISFIFAISQAPVMMKYSLEKEDDEADKDATEDKN